MNPARPENVTASAYCAFCGRAQGGPWADHRPDCVLLFLVPYWRRLLKGNTDA